MHLSQFFSLIFQTVIKFAKHFQENKNSPIPFYRKKAPLFVLRNVEA